MKDHSVNHSTYWLLLQVMFRAKQHVYAIAEHHGITTMQANALGLLKEDEPLPMSSLSSHLMCDASNVTGIVDRLANQGLIERREHPSDRRIKMITLTAKGAQLRQAIMQEVAEIEQKRLMPLLSPEERATLDILLGKLLAEKINSGADEKTRTSTP